ncbi:DNA-binding response regulator, partial [human gut metagenome]
MLILTFEDNEDDMMNRILSLINTREEVIQMSGMNNYLLSFK